MNSGSASGAVHVLYMVLFMGASGCAATSMVGRGTRALEKTAKSMDQTRDALRESDQTMKELVSSLEKLQAPMKTLGTLTGPMRNLSALGTPLQNVAALSPQMERLGTRLEGVETNLQRLETPLDNLGSLPRSLDRVRELEKPLQAIASFGHDENKIWMALIGFFVTWTVATFAGVYGGFVVALRRRRRIRGRKKITSVVGRAGLAGDTHCGT
jgi:HAMP domain-containing protein